MEIHQPGINESDVVASLNGLTGDVTLSAGTNITLNTVGNDITINSTGGSTWDKPFGDAEFTYDVDGNVETKTVGLTVLTFTYDVDGNVETIS